MGSGRGWGSSTLWGTLRARVEVNEDGHKGHRSGMQWATGQWRVPAELCWGWSISAGFRFAGFLTDIPLRPHFLRLGKTNIPRWLVLTRGKALWGQGSYQIHFYFLYILDIWHITGIQIIVKQYSSNIRTITSILTSRITIFYFAQYIVVLYTSHHLSGIITWQICVRWSREWLTFGFEGSLLLERSPKVLAPVGLFLGCGNLRKRFIKSKTVKYGDEINATTWSNVRKILPSFIKGFLTIALPEKVNWLCKYKLTNSYQREGRKCNFC